MNSQPLTILALECSTSACSVAVREHGVLRAEIAPSGSKQAETLLPAVAEAMDRAGTPWNRINLIAVSVGPGSFTGLRIGLSAARGLALARKLPVVGVGTAELLASQVPIEQMTGRRLLVAIDSKRDDIFVQPFFAANLPAAKIRAVTPEQALEWQPGRLLVVGDAAERFHGLRDDIEIAPSSPQAAALAALAEIEHRAGRGLPAQPLYLRAPDVTLPS